MLRKFFNLGLLISFLILITSCSAIKEYLEQALQADVEAPQPVTNLKAEAQDAKIQLSWTDPTSSDLEKIELYFAWLDASTPVTKGKQAYDVTGLTNGTAYAFTVYAVDSSGNKSNGVSATATPSAATSSTLPTTPTLNASTSSGQVILSWSLTDTTNIESVEIVSAQENQTHQVSANVSSKTITGLTNFTTYQFTLYLITNNDQKSEGKSVSVTPKPTNRPDDVSSLSALGGDAKATLSWQLPSGVSIAKLLLSDGVATTQTVTASLTATTLSGLTNGQTYSFTMWVVDSNGVTSNGTSISAIPQVVSQLELQGLTAQAGFQAVTFSWQAPTQITFDHVSISYTGGTTVTINKGTNTSKISGLTNGTAYTFTIKKVDTNNVSSTGIQLSATPENQTPAAKIAISSASSYKIGSSIVLDASTSADPDGTTLNYQWSLVSTPNNSTVQIANATSAQATLTPDKFGQYSVQLVVGDGEVSSNVVYDDFDSTIAWESIGIGQTGTVCALYLTQNTLFASIENATTPANSGIYKSNITTISWSNISPDFTLVSPSTDQHDKSATHFFEKDSVLYAPLQWVGMFRSTDYGTTWTLVHEPPNPAEGYARMIADPTNTNRIFSGTHNGQTGYSMDNGLNWTVQDGSGPGTGGAHTSALIYDSSDTILFAGSGRNGEFRKSTDHGYNWTTIESDLFPTDSYIISLERSGDTIYIFFKDGTVIKTADSAVTFTKILDTAFYTKGDGNNYIASGNTLLCGGDKIMLSQDKGQTFTSIVLPSDMQKIRSTYLINNQVYIVGDGIYRTDPWW